MKTVLGQLNREYLVNLLSASYPASKLIRMAVAYADFHEPLVRHVQEHPDVKLKFYGRLDHTGAVSMRLLEWFLKTAPATAECFLVNGRYHPKVIWWESFGAYLGSANLTTNGWQRNIEAGVFLSEDELEEQGIAEDLELLFDHLDEVSLPLIDEVFAKLQLVEDERRRHKARLDAIKAKFDEVLGSEKPYAGLTNVPAKGERKPSAAEQRFVEEWRSTLQRMRRLCREFEATGKRPSWVPESANPTVHFDQFLHGYYYHYIEATSGGGKAVDKVEEIHAKNSRDPAAAFAEATTWWASLAEPPTQNSYNEQVFITERAPRMQELLSQTKLPVLTLDEFTEAMSHSHAFREHARHFDRPEGLAAHEQEPEDDKLRRMTAAIWAARTRQGDRNVLEVLEFLIYGTKPSDAERRLWMACRSKEWQLPHLQRSTLGELIGWARPDEYPPRNNRNNLALRALGYDVAGF